VFAEKRHSACTIGAGYKKLMLRAEQKVTIFILIYFRRQSPTTTSLSIFFNLRSVMKSQHQKIQDIKKYFETELSTGIMIREKGSKVIIDTPIINTRTIGLAIAFVVIIAVSANVDISFYFFALLTGYGIMLTLIWLEFDLLNSVVLDLNSNTLQIRSNNLIKRILWNLLKWNKPFRFEDIARFTLSHKFEFNISDRYYLIELILRNDKRIKLFYTQKNDYAVKAIGFLRDITRLK
jgi:hypothetical protein